MLTNKWRPEGFKNPYPDLIYRQVNTKTNEIEFEFSEHRAFEAGADAMLESLFKLAKASPTGKFEIDSRVIQIYGEEDDADGQG